MTKKFFLGVAGMIFAVVMAMNLQAGKNEANATDVNLELIKQTASAACEMGAGLPGGPLSCLSIWCQSTFSYSGCGPGNGIKCNTWKDC